MFQVPRPIKRSKLRQKAGRTYFVFKRKILWYLGGERYARRIQVDPFPVVLKEHASTLLRPLKDVDMQLQYNKVTNLQLAADKLNGIIIRPGETFSFWKLVGKPTARKGYLPGLVLQNGQITSGTGGGLCQLGNLLYWMLLHTPLTITQRWRHSYDVFPDINRSLPFGSGATLAYNYIDLQFRNDTAHNFQLMVWLSSDQLHGKILSDFKLPYRFQVLEKNHRFEQQYWGGYTRHNEIWKLKINSEDDVVEEIMVTENHALMMYNPLLSGS